LFAATKKGHLALEQVLEEKLTELNPQPGLEDQQQTRFAVIEVLTVLAVVEASWRTATKHAEALVAQVFWVWCHSHILGPGSLAVEHAMIVHLELEQYHFVERQQNHSAVAALHDFQVRDVHSVAVQVGMELVPVVTGHMSQEQERQTGCSLLMFALHSSEKEEEQIVDN